MPRDLVTTRHRLVLHLQVLTGIFALSCICSNKKSSAVKRILSEARELEEATPEFVAAPLDDNIFEWHFTLRGPSSTEFEEGYYHGRIILPSEYPFRPPDVMILTPNGRWELNKKVRGRHWAES